MLLAAQVLTHGFVLDEKGTKMSKSIGNVVDPLEVRASQLHTFAKSLEIAPPVTCPPCLPLPLCGGACACLWIDYQRREKPEAKTSLRCRREWRPTDASLTQPRCRPDSDPGLDCLQVLRLWVASVDYTSDVCIGDNIIKQVFESYRRLRNTARYLIGNLKDFDPAADSVPYDELASMDKFILGRFSEVAAEVTNAYENYQFFRASQVRIG